MNCPSTRLLDSAKRLASTDVQVLISLVGPSDSSSCIDTIDQMRELRIKTETLTHFFDILWVGVGQIELTVSSLPFAMRS
jgi:hypothetical protein